MGYNTASEPSETAVIDALVATGRFNRNRSLDNKVKVTFAFAERGDVRYSDRTFTSEPLKSIAGNYSPQVVNQVQTVVSELNELEKGIVIIHGVPGTGKTHLIRSMLSDCAQRTPVVCNPPLEFLNNMGMLNSVMTNYDSSLIILEDLGDVLSKSAPAGHVGVYTNLLNVTDGLLSLLSNSIVVMSFNTEIGTIDPAIMRAGRCLANIEVGKLEYSHVNSLLEEDGLGHLSIPKGSYSLADVYEIKRLKAVPEQLAATSTSPMGLGRR